MARSIAVIWEQVWEQTVLPWRARGSILVNFANTAPLASARSITMIHDAQSFTAETSYSGWFARWYRYLLPKLGRRNLRILTVSEFSASQLVSFDVVTPDRITVIPNGIDHVREFGCDPAIIDTLGLRDRQYVVALSSTQTHKNIAVLFAALADGAADDIVLVLVGKAGRADFEESGIAVPASAIFAGKVSDAGLRSLLEGALCSATPSLTEGFGLPPLEAMSLGCPAVVAPCGALPEVCGEAALYADPHAPEDWRAAFVRLLDPTLRATLVTRGRAQAERFTWHAAGSKLIDTVRQCRAAL